jgi:hypothetical protein
MSRGCRTLHRREGWLAISTALAGHWSDWAAYCAACLN